MKRFLSDWTLALVAAAVIVVALGWLSRDSPEPTLAPDFTIETLDGESFTLSDYRGQTVVVNFWGTWCPPCVAEIPEFSKYANEHPEVKVIGIAVRSGRSAVTKMKRDKGIVYDLAIAPKNAQVLDDYEMNSQQALFPTTFVIDGEGMIRSGRIERKLSYEELEELVVSASSSPD